MKIGWVKWVKVFDADEDKAEIARLRELLNTEDEVWDAIQGALVPDTKLTTSELSLPELREVHELLKDRVKSPFLEATEVAALAEEIKLRSDPRWIEEQVRKAAERKEAQRLTEARVLREGLTALGGTGTKWSDRADEIAAWWKAVKEAEAKETWAGAFAANRISARQVNTAGRGGSFSVVNLHERKNTDKRREIVLDRTVEGVLERLKPGNFRDPITSANSKVRLGLHDLSASLLDSGEGKPTLDKQLKFYKDATLVLMPVPTERDSKIFHAICSLTEPDADALRAMRNRFTRIRLAQGSDMHTIFVDDSTGAPAQPQFRYGVTGRVHLRNGDVVGADADYLAARRTNALEHSAILGDGATQPVNEIVMVYREHASEVFPLFVKWDEDNKRFNVLKRTNLKETTGDHIDNKGAWHDAEK
ncbi:hypothetical protein JOD54_005168 [Actinokineospora baliensis]|uniref:hypothetical protein n=1 Tax=Actinokineospora baliensis TaxID=547056 RepID=UPI00195D535C|nr:hypothetical protein [Actinokineospora baliensis]MBM7774964.1 hypothetical protein [Actinokineospora baliensis]